MLKHAASIDVGEPIREVRATADGRSVAIVGQRSLFIARVDGSVLQRAAEDAPAGFATVACHPSANELAAATMDGQLWVISAATGALVRRLAAEEAAAGPTEPYEALFFSRDGASLFAHTIARGRTERIDWAHGAVTGAHEDEVPTTWVPAAARHPHEDWFAQGVAESSLSSFVLLAAWTADEMTPVCHGGLGVPSFISKVVFSADGTLVATAGTRQGIGHDALVMRIHALPTGETLRTDIEVFPRAAAPLSALRHHWDGVELLPDHACYGAADGSLRIVPLRDGPPIHTLPLGDGLITSLARVPGANLLAVGTVGGRCHVLEHPWRRPALEPATVSMAERLRTTFGPFRPDNLEDFKWVGIDEIDPVWEPGDTGDQAPED